MLDVHRAPCTPAPAQPHFNEARAQEALWGWSKALHQQLLLFFNYMKHLGTGFRWTTPAAGPLPIMHPVVYSS